MHLSSILRSSAFIRFLSTLLVIVLFVSSTPLNGKQAVVPSSDPSVVSSFQTFVDIPSGSDMIIRYSPKDQCFDVIDDYSIAEGFSDVVQQAIIKSPVWIQNDLVRQFHSLVDPEPYAWLIVNASKQMTDELAFSIAASPIGDIASVDVLYDNVFWLYEIDKDIQYADIIDYDPGDGQYYSTIRYKSLQNGSVKQLEYPRELYYWYIVHPELLGENAQEVYGDFWRSFLYNHNDRNYPLLKEKIHAIEFLWDHCSYSQPGNRIWDEWISHHPTAIEAVSYWVGKTVPFEATGDRPNQPNIIAHEHNGWCGELQRLSLAAMRTLLIPTVGVCNIGEDHVWREFYDEGWHQNDNWWTDSGGAVDVADVYWNGWGKAMSAIYAGEGDGSIYDVTSRYIDEEDRIHVDFHVHDGFGNPYDGARVTVLVKGLKDITWYKTTIWGIIEEIWNKLPEFLRETVLSRIRDRLEDRFDEIPDVVDGVTVSIWNYTSVDGHCCFELGNQDEYVFLIQGGTHGFSWPCARFNSVRLLNSTEDARFTIGFPIFARRPVKIQDKIITEGDYCIQGRCVSSFYQVQENLRNMDSGIYHFDAMPIFFIVDTVNYERYKTGQGFDYLYQWSDLDQVSNIHFSDDVYIICHNPTYQSTARISIDLMITCDLEKDSVTFSAPTKTLFDTPCYSIGDVVTLSGYTTSEMELYIANEKVKPILSGQWSYRWNTKNLQPGIYCVKAICNDVVEMMNITLFDVTPPMIFIDLSDDATIVRPSDIIEGQCHDESGIQKVEVSIDKIEWQMVSNDEEWSYQIGDLPCGIHQVWVQATDNNGHISTRCKDIVIAADSDEFIPVINSISHTQGPISNTTNVIVLVNITSNDHFPVKHAMLSIRTASDNRSIPLYQYATDPILPRHSEDPFSMVQNTPIFGCELGVFQSDETVWYSVHVVDVGDRFVESEERSFTVE